MMDVNDLKGKVVLVSGASAGIGAAVAVAFAGQGARVAVHYNGHKPGGDETLARIRAIGAEGALFQADLSDSAQCARLVDETQRNFGRIDVLVNNAGGFVRRELLGLADDELIEKVFNLNARSVMACCRRVIPLMRAQGGGTIINVTSQAARAGSSMGSGLYAASKAFVSTYTRALAKELADQGIRVNAVAPGVIETRIHEHTSVSTMQQLTAAIPMRRLGRVDECTGAFLYLASEQLSSYVTGQVLEVNGGSAMP